jgi:hypothetical protein
LHFDQKLKDHLMQANLYFLFAKRYEYVDPQKHMFFYQKHFNAVMKLEQHYMMLEGNFAQQPMYGQFPMY